MFKKFKEDPEPFFLHGGKMVSRSALKDTQPN
jgi:hypothetical protein